MTLMRDIVESALGLLLIVGLVVGAVAYTPMRDKLIREKGYDADYSGGRALSILTLLAFALGYGMFVDGNASTSIAMLSFAVGIILLVVNVLKRAKALGVGSAILITLVQTLSMVWLFFVWFVKTAWRMFNGFTSQHIDDQAKAAKANKAAERKAALMREYEASVAAIERGSDEVSVLTGEAAAAIDQATADYEREVEMIDHEYKD